jgi:hypothetical protein
MERDKNYRQKLILNKRWILIGAVVLTALALLVIVTRSKAEQPEIVSLSDLAAGIAQGSVARIEDSIFSGEFTVHYQDGKTVKGMRDPTASLLEQLNLPTDWQAASTSSSKQCVRRAERRPLGC